MKTHLEHLLDTIPDLRRRYVLDLGSGRGKFLVDLAKHNVRARGLEINPAYITISRSLAKENGVTITVDQGMGEHLPYKDSMFDFINMCEVIEHVNNPERVMREAYRVLKPGGLIYMSVPNRYGIKDQHFNLYFVNWLPRRLSDSFVSLFGKHKSYSGEAGLQKLSEMHYYTFRSSKKFIGSLDFFVSDIRTQKIEKMYSSKIYCRIITLAYLCLRPFYFDSFHLLLGKK